MIRFLPATCFALTLASATFAQGNGRLDNDRSFQDFTLGDSFDRWESEVRYLIRSANGIRRYEYTGSCCQQMFGAEVLQIVLGFENRTLVHIEVRLPPYSTGECSAPGQTPRIFRPVDTEGSIASFNRLRDMLIARFGQFDESGYNDDDGSPALLTYLWAGSHTILLANLVDRGICGFISANVQVLNRATMESLTEDGF